MYIESLEPYDGKVPFVKFRPANWKKHWRHSQGVEFGIFSEFFYTSVKMNLYLSVVVGWELCDRSGKLRHFDLFLVKISFDTGKDDLPLPRLKPVHQGWDRTLVVHVREQNQLFVDEIL